MKCSLSTNEPYETIELLFRTELERTHPRSTITLESQDGNAVFTITSDDITAMRAAMNSITSVLSTHMKANGI